MTEKITSPGDLAHLADKARVGIDLREGSKDVRVTVHMGTCGIAAGARGVVAAFMRELSASSVDNVTLRQSGCAGLCEEEPMITITDADGKIWRYGLLDDGRVHEIVARHLKAGTPVESLLITS
jgi:NADP-reducing hydrogenase subunit HndB